MAAMNLPTSIFVGIMSIFLMLSFFSNVMVVVVIAKNRRMRTATNLLITNLAISDCFMAAFIIPQNIHDITHVEEFYEGDAACKIVNSLPIFCIVISIYSLVGMSVERYRAICIITATSMTLNKAKTVSASIWFLGLLIAIPSMAEYSVYEYDKWLKIPSNQSVEEYISDPSQADEWAIIEAYDNGTSLWHDIGLGCGSTIHRAYGITNGIFIVLVAYVIPLVIIVVNYSRLTSFILRESKAKEEGSQRSQVSRKKVKILKMLIIVAALFALSWLPYFTLLAIAKMTGEDDSSAHAGAMNMLRIGLTIFSVSYNVYLYLIYNPLFREGFRQLLCPCIKSSSVAPADLEATATVTTMPSSRAVPYQHKGS